MCALLCPLKYCLQKVRIRSANYMMIFERDGRLWVDQKTNSYPNILRGSITFRTLAIPSTSSISIGRPMKSFEECSEQTKRRKTEGIRKSLTDSELLYATQMSLRDASRTNLPIFLKKWPGITCWTKNRAHIEKYSEDERLALLIRNRLSKRTYCDIQKGGKRRDANIYPPYNQILSAKGRCYPAESSIKVTESSAEISL